MKDIVEIFRKEKNEKNDQINYHSNDIYVK